MFSPNAKPILPGGKGAQNQMKDTAGGFDSRLWPFWFGVSYNIGSALVLHAKRGSWSSVLSLV